MRFGLIVPGETKAGIGIASSGSCDLCGSVYADGLSAGERTRVGWRADGSADSNRLCRGTG